MQPGVDEVVLVYLVEVGARADADSVPSETTVAGIGDVLGFEKRSLADRVELLSTLDELVGDGLIVERDAVVEDRSVATAYVLTDAGVERARRLREDYREREVPVRGADADGIRLADAEQYVDAPALPRALAHLVDGDAVRTGGSTERFVNRETELDALETVVERVAGGDPVTVLVAGEAGVGKTTLVTDEFVARASAAGIETVVEGFRGDAPEPYAPIRDALDALGALDAADAPLEVDDAEPSDAEEYASERSERFAAVAERLSAAGVDRPVVVVVEDLHLAGEATVALLSALGEHVENGVGIVGTYRPEDLPADHPLQDLAEDWTATGASGAVVHRHLSLSPLDRDHTRRLISTLVGESTVPAGFVDAVYGHTGGNPLFVEESVSRTLAEGIADPSYDVYPTDWSELPVPETVSEAVGLRFETVEGLTEEVLRVAALIGQEIPTDVLVAALDHPRAEVERRIDLLVDARILERADDELRFASGLVRESCVEGVDPDRTAAYHRNVADAYAEVRSDDPDRHAAVARHRRAAGDYERAFEAYREAGERALELYAAETAAAALETAHAVHSDDLDRPDDDEDRLELLDRLATTQVFRDDYAAADRYLRYVAERTDDPDRRRDIAVRRAALWRERGDYQRAIDVVVAARDAVGVAETAESADLVGFEAFLHSKRADYDAAEEHYERAIELAEAVGDEALIARMRRSKAHVDLERGTLDEETLSTFEAAIEASREEGDEVNVGIGLLNLGVALSEYGDFERAEARLEEAIEQFETIGVENHVCDARNTLGTILASQCKWDEARETYETVLETARRIDNERLETYARINTMELEESRGAIDRAREAAQAGLSAAEALGNQQYRVETLLGLVRLALAADDPETAAGHADAAVETAEGAGVDEVVPRALARKGDVERVRGNPSAALETYDRGLDRRETVGEAAGAARIPLRVGAARAALAAGDWERAVSEATAAVSAAEAGAGPEDLAPEIQARTVAGAVARERGDLETAAEYLTAVHDRATEEGRRLRAWRAGYELARLDRERGQDERARERLREIRDAAADGGAERLCRRCEAALSSEGHPR